jgi:hypothetical protein
MVVACVARISWEILTSFIHDSILETVNPFANWKINL